MNKPTKEQDQVMEFLENIEHPQRRADAIEILDMLKKVTGEFPALWGNGIIGFGRYHYVYESGREGDWFLIGFSPRKQNLSLYIMPGFARYEALLGQLGSYKTGKSCLYIKALADVDEAILLKLMEEAYAHMKNQHA